MVEMKSGGVVLGLAAQLASWRAVLVLVRTWATFKAWQFKAWQRKDFFESSILRALCLKQSRQTIWDSVGSPVGTKSKKVGKGRRKRQYADVDGSSANRELELGLRGPALQKQVLQGFDEVAMCPELEPEDYVCVTDYRPRKSRRKTEPLSEDSEAMDPPGSPSSVRKVADTTCPSSSSPSVAPVPGWRSFLCLGNG